MSHIFSLIAIVIFVQNMKSILTWKDLKSKIRKIFRNGQRTLDKNLLYHLMIKQELKVVRKPIFLYPVTLQELPSEGRHPQVYVEVKWNHIEILHLRSFKKVLFLYGMHSLYKKQVLNSWVTQNRIIPKVGKIW